jgi:hypothetical protein
MTGYLQKRILSHYRVLTEKDSHDRVLTEKDYLMTG